MGESSNFPKSWTFEIQTLKLVVGLQIINNFKFNGQLSLDELILNQRSFLFDLFVWFDSLRPINNLSVKQGQVFLGWTSTKLG